MKQTENMSKRDVRVMQWWNAQNRGSKTLSVFAIYPSCRFVASKTIFHSSIVIGQFERNSEGD